MPREFSRAILEASRRSLVRVYLPRIVHCLNSLSESQLWWKPHRASNSVGNLVLHLSGNVRQWVVSGLGGSTDVRRRDEEFDPPAKVNRHDLLKKLRSTVHGAARVLERLSPKDLERFYRIQGFRTRGLTAILHVTEHFAYHTGQIIFATKVLRRQDLRFTRLPGEKGNQRAGKKFPSL